MQFWRRRLCLHCAGLVLAFCVPRYAGVAQLQLQSLSEMVCTGLVNILSGLFPFAFVRLLFCHHMLRFLNV